MPLAFALSFVLLLVSDWSPIKPIRFLIFAATLVTFVGVVIEIIRRGQKATVQFSVETISALAGTLLFGVITVLVGGNEVTDIFLACSVAFAVGLLVAGFTMTRDLRRAPAFQVTLDTEDPLGLL
jgi:FtsH-binding integral membrane protein